MKIETLIKRTQEAMNKKGSNLLVDGKWGPITAKEADKFQISIEVQPNPIDNPDTGHNDNTGEPIVLEPTIVVLNNIEFKNRGNYVTPSGKFKGLTIHSTESGRSANAAKNVVAYLKSKGYGCMVMDENGIIYIPKNFDIFKNWGNHSGVSKWKEITNVSNKFAGMEVCNWGKNSTVGPFREVNKAEGYIVSGKYQSFTKAQEAALINFILWAKTKNKTFDLDNVVGHDELRAEAGKRGDKSDPGGSLSVPMSAFRAQIKAKAAALGI